jgi:MoxR-like ATPase
MTAPKGTASKEKRSTASSVAGTAPFARYLVGRQNELDLLTQLVSLHRNVLIEGPVGAGKTFLVLSCLKKLGWEYERVDGDSRYTENKLTGWFDPPQVLKKGYTAKTFLEGPLVRAMRLGRVLFINELNRMPEGVQNILLPAMDEKSIQIPKLGELKAKPGFLVVGTQNPREFTATHSLSEALLDRFEMVKLDYQCRDDERTILLQQMEHSHGRLTPELVDRTVDLVRSTRAHPSIRRGASIRAGISMCELMASGIEFRTAAHLSLPSRMDLVSGEESAEKILEDLLSGQPLPHWDQKKSPHL